MLCFGHRARREEAAQLAPLVYESSERRGAQPSLAKRTKKKKTLKQSKGALVHSPFCGAPSAALKQAL